MLEIFLLGGTVFRLPGRPTIQIAGQKEIGLLAYLAYTGQAHGREALADLLWDADSTRQALSNLRTVLTRLRKQVGDHLLVSRKTVAVTPAVHEATDTARFQAMLASVGNEPSLTGTNLVAQGLALYKGELMQGFYLPHAPRFNDWLLVEQERLRQVAMNGYRRLAGWQEKQGAFSAGVKTAQQWVAWDPLDETAQQQSMRLLAFDGRATEALSVYEKCRDLLQTDLGILPSSATTALYEAIQDGSLTAPDIALAPLHNLPRALTSLFGRKDEISRLTSYLLNPEYPLISITGAGGMGKTSLALATGRQLLAEEKQPFKDGIWFVSLEAITNDTPGNIGEEVAALVGQAMGLFFHAQSDLWSQLLGQLATKNLLLILDNIEQFLPVASDLIMDLLRAGQGIHLLVTSRTTLALAATVAFPLEGLETPTEVSPEALQNDSVRLFAERAARMPAPFQLEKNMAEVVAICRFVEGMPLGIELAAASLGRLLIDEIMPALTSNLRLLDSTRRDLPPRQRTLRAVFDYTWDLLDARERTLLAQISILRGGFTRQAAEAVIGDVAGLYNLQLHALLSRDGTGRFRMHSLLRQLARERLSDPDMSEVAEAVMNRHCHYFTHLANSFEDDLRRGLGQEALQIIFPEQANLRAAWQHALQSGQWQAIADCLGSVHYYYQRKGFFSEEATLVDDAMTSLQASIGAGDVLLSILLGRLLIVRARGYLNSAYFEDGLKTARQACELAQSLESADLEAGARLAWARILSRQHEHELALAQFERVVALAKSTGDQILEADGWIGIGGQLIWPADVGQAQEPLGQALHLCQTHQYKQGEMRALRLLGTMAFRQGALHIAEKHHQRALDLSLFLGDVVAEAEELGSLGVVSHRQGDLVASKLYKEQALATFRRLNMPESEQWLMGELGNTAILLGDHIAAEQYLTDALTMARQLKDEFWQAWVNLRLGTLSSERGNGENALSFIGEAHQTATKFGNPRFLAAVLCEWGHVLLSFEEWDKAAEKYEAAYDLWSGAGQDERSMTALAGMAYAAQRRELPESAAAHAERLWQSWQESPAWAERADLRLYWLLGVTWEGLEDGRAGDLWAKARALLLERSEKIPEEGPRKMFLEQVPAHRAIAKVPVV